MTMKKIFCFRSKLSLAILHLILLFFLVGWTTPDRDKFYQASPKPGGSPGDIIDVRKSVYTLDPVFKIPYPGIKSWQIIYQSENATGETIAVSGTVLVPRKRWWYGPRPIVGYSVGSRGLGDQCAPSFTMSKGTDYESSLVLKLLRKGWAVAVSDYEGLGTPGIHTFMVGQSQGRVALDVIRAALQLNEAKLSRKAPIALMGYEQGGTSASWAAQLAAQYAPELNIVAAVVGGVSADLEENGRYLDGTLYMGMALMTSIGLNTSYSDLNLESFLNDKGQELLSKSEDVCIVDPDDIPTKLCTMFKSVDDLTLTNPFDNPQWQYRMGEQKLGLIPPTMPVLLYHATRDPLVPYEPAEKLHKDWCNLGVNVKAVPMHVGHVTAHFIRGPLTTIPWLKDRFKGIPAIDNCQ